MDYAYRLVSNVKYLYNSINPATLSGAIDVVVVEQPDGTLKSTPFHVRFGKYGVFSYSEKYVDITINNEEIDLKMKLGQSGVAFFVEETDETVPDYLATSPLPESTEQSQTLPDTTLVLNESARKLEIHTREPKQRLLSECSDISESRSPSPPCTSRESHAEKEAKAAEKEKGRRLALPLLSSVFSQRKNRSLPDLTSITDQHNGYLTDTEDVSSAKRPKSEGVSPNRRKYSYHSSLYGHKRSLSNKGISSITAEQGFLESLAERKRTLGRRKKSRVAFATEPISIQIEIENDSPSSSTVSSPSGSVGESPDVDALAEGCLSDSELDHGRREDPRPRANDVTDWQWGELPETREDKEKKAKEAQKADEAKKERSSWWPSWTTWRARSPQSSEKKEEQGIYLDDLVGKDGVQDPVQIEKYLGKTAPMSVTSDSGNGSSRSHSQPSSPTMFGSSANSDTELADKTPTQESVSTALSKKEHLPTDTLPRARFASDQRSSASENIFALSEDESETIEVSDGRRYYRSLRLSSEKLKSLGLEYGSNDVRFSITTKFQGTTWCSCNVYLYKWYDKIVISDIDGTITKSDVLGHVIPAIGGQWAHTGVAELYSRIKNNGYKIVYLSSRAIGQSHTTKQYLKSVAQEQRALPDGPVLLSPTSVLVAFRREVIERRPEEFKIAALTDLKQLFPVKQPFFAGFGNRDTDTISYRAVDIPLTRILIIDPSGKVKRADSRGLVSTYHNMASETVDYLFPPLSRKFSLKNKSSPSAEKLHSNFSVPLTHSCFTHWRNEELLSLLDADLAQYEAKRAELEEQRKKAAKK